MEICVEDPPDEDDVPVDCVTTVESLGAAGDGVAANVCGAAYGDATFGRLSCCDVDVSIVLDPSSTCMAAGLSLESG